MEQVVASDGTPIAYRVGGRGEPVLFVHGAIASSADWGHVARLLRERFTIVTLDRRGRGRSGFGGEPYSIVQEAEDIAVVAAKTNARKIVAHSYGGLCTMTALERGVHADQLVLYEPPVSVPPGTFGAHTRLAGHINAGSHDAAAAMFLSAADATDAELAAIRQSPVWPSLVDSVPSLARELDEVQAWTTPAGPFDIPTLLLIGGDTTSPSYLDGVPGIASAFPRLQRQQITGQRHLGHVLAPEAFAAAVGDFLT